jgi:hypothetical protein
VHAIPLPVHVEPAQQVWLMPPQLAHMLSVPQTWPVEQPGQVTATPQLSITVPHFPEQVVVMLALVQLQTLLLQVCGNVQSAFEQQPPLGMQADPHILKVIAQE